MLKLNEDGYQGAFIVFCLPLYMLNDVHNITKGKETEKEKCRKRRERGDEKNNNNAIVDTIIA